MCGVAAAYAYAGHAPAVNRERLRAVRDHMAARGPDGAGEWWSGDGRVGLAHRRLAIIDLSDGGVQPMASADGSVVISFNGEIYNHRELRRELQQRGRVFRTDSDTEVLLHLYELHGTRMLPMLRGMFGFALWDSGRRGLLLARDAFGIKPLYYADDGKTLAAASQVKALLHAGVDTSRDPAGHTGFFLWGSVPEPWTLYRGIRSLPAGHFLWADAAGARAPEAFERVSDILAAAVGAPARGSRSDALEAIAAAIHDSARAHLVSDVPVGLFLSGGVDSGMLACATVDAGVRPRAITLGFPEYAGRPDDERELASRLAGQLGLTHIVSVASRDAFEEERVSLLQAMDQPSIDGVNSWFIARAAAAHGMKVALSGLGGDELFASYPSFRQVPRLHRWLKWPARVPLLGKTVRRIAEPLVRHLASPKYAGLLEYAGTWGGAYLLRRGLFMPWELSRVMDADMALQGWREITAAAQLDADASLGGRRDAPDRLRVSSLEMNCYMRNQLLRDADWAGMAHSVEIRVPFVDAPLLRSVAPWFAAYPDIDKVSVARAAAPQLRPQWFERPKTGFLVPVREWVGGPAQARRGLRPWAQLVHSAAARRAPGCRPRVLVSTLAPGNGGVNAMTTFVVDLLARRGLEPIVAHYAPYSVTPRLSVPSFSLLQRRVGSESGSAYGGVESHAIGAWLPELEFTHYAATRRWRELIGSCDAHVAVSGNILAATAYWQTGQPFLAWVATDWEGDRRDRVRAFPATRRLLDRVVNGPVIRSLERSLVRAGCVLPLSEYTARMLRRIAGDEQAGPVLPMAVDTDFFVPGPTPAVAGRIGFAGRFSDARKNIGLLLATVAQLRGQGRDVTALVVGDTPDAALLGFVESLGISDAVEFAGPLGRSALLPQLQRLDVFVVPSHQEGLCIAALEAMACGAPVVSTRCGGPEEFVLDGETGFLADSEPAAIGDAIWRIVGDRAVRARMSDAGVRLVRERYSRHRAEQVFWRSFSSTFPALSPVAP